MGGGQMGMSLVSGRPLAAGRCRERSRASVAIAALAAVVASLVVGVAPASAVAGAAYVELAVPRDRLAAVRRRPSTA